MDFRNTISLGVIVFALFTSNAQQTVTIDLNNKYQTIQGFGASDAWNSDYVGRYWSTTTKEQIAKWLFSTEIVGNNPSGIGLSRWRFNIGAGSKEQGAASNIDKEERRAECFISKVETIGGKEVITYDWDKQKGQQWFLNAAKQYNVNQLVAFIVSPPVFFTKNGRANSDNKDVYGNTNLNTSKYNQFSDFIVTVLKHFSDQGTPFSQISPINEPQYPWDKGQEGCPWKHSEVYTLVDKLNTGILAKGLTTKILLSEAEEYTSLTESRKDPDKSDIIDKYFSPASATYIGKFPQVLKGAGAHSYWVNDTDAIISSKRIAVKNKIAEYSGLEVYQTEYNLLDKYTDNKTTNAVILAKIIYADLELAGVSIWDYWTAMERERWSQLNRFLLIKLTPSGGDYADLTNPGTASVDKNLWALGNYSRFIRPGYKRVKTTGANDLAGLMGVSFVAPDNSEVITVYTNFSDKAISINEKFNNLSTELKAEIAEVYTTNSTNNLTKGTNHTLKNAYSIPSKSIVTFRIPLKTSSLGVDDVNYNDAFVVFPNPTSNGYVNITSDSKENMDIEVSDVLGKQLKRVMINNNTLNVSDLDSGTYILRINQGEKTSFKKLVIE